jgi:hypothetical protein
MTVATDAPTAWVIFPTVYMVGFKADGIVLTADAAKVGDP